MVTFLSEGLWVTFCDSCLQAEAMLGADDQRFWQHPVIQATMRFQSKEETGCLLQLVGDMLHPQDAHRAILANIATSPFFEPVEQSVGGMVWLI